MRKEKREEIEDGVEGEIGTLWSKLHIYYEVWAIWITLLSLSVPISNIETVIAFSSYDHCKYFLKCKVLLEHSFFFGSHRPCNLTLRNSFC